MPGGYDDLAGAKKFLKQTEGSVKRTTPGGGTRDIELPNDTGEIDPRLTAANRYPSKARPASTKGEQPKDLVSNVALRRKLMSGR